MFAMVEVVITNVLFLMAAQGTVIATVLAIARPAIYATSGQMVLMHAFLRRFLTSATLLTSMCAGMAMSGAAYRDRIEKSSLRWMPAAGMRLVLQMLMM
jgi:hypothetical protein